MISIQKVASRKQRKDFLNLTDQVYANYPLYVPVLKVDLRGFMKTKHPFYRHGDAQFYIAYKDNVPAGRICAYINNQYNDYHKEPVGFFGSFECINDQEVADQLFHTAKQWLLERGLTSIRGPVDYYSNEPQGALIEGFDSLPPVPLAYHPNYYQDLLANHGFKKQADLYAYEVDDMGNTLPFHRGKMLLDRVTERKGITFRQLNFKDIDEEVKKVVVLFNDFEKVNGQNFAPITEEEARHFTKMMKPIIDPNMCLFAEVGGKPIAFVCAIPDVNELLVKVKKGNLFPTGIFKLLTLKKKNYRRVRIMLLGMYEEYQKIGLGPAMCYKVLGYAKEKGFTAVDMSMVHEDNTFMCNLGRRLGGQVYKTYRVYEKEIA